MMSNTNEDEHHFSVTPCAPPPPPPPPNFMPVQWNMAPEPNGANGFSASSPWDVPQIGPQNFPSPPAYQWNVQPFMNGQNIPNNIIPQLTGVTACHQIFAKGKPKALGIVLIITALCQLLFAISLPFLADSVTMFSGIQYWGPIFYIIAGSFSIRAQKKQNIRLVKLSYGFSIVSSIVSIIAMIINIVDFSLIHCEENHDCFDEGIGVYIMVAILFVHNLLVFCVSVSISVFGGRAVDHAPSDAPQVFVIQNMMPVPPTAYPANSSETPLAPPPYNIQDENCFKSTTDY